MPHSSPRRCLNSFYLFDVLGTGRLIRFYCIRMAWRLILTVLTVFSCWECLKVKESCPTVLLKLLQDKPRLMRKLSDKTLSLSFIPILPLCILNLVLFHHFLAVKMDSVLSKWVTIQLFLLAAKSHHNKHNCRMRDFLWAHLSEWWGYHRCIITEHKRRENSDRNSVISMLHLGLNIIYFLKMFVITVTEQRKDIRHHKIIITHFGCCDKDILILYVQYVQYRILGHPFKPSVSAEHFLRDILYLLGCNIFP